MAQLTSRTELTEPADNDLLHIIDTSDTTDGALGTSKKIQHSNLMKGIDAANVDIADAGTIITATDVEGALQEIMGDVDDAESDIDDLEALVTQDVTTTGTPQFAGVQLGGTGAAHTLDDYETGTFTPTVTYSGGNGTLTYTSQVGVYVIIGDLICCYGIVQINSEGTASGNLTITGLPEATASALDTHTPVLLRCNGLTGVAGHLQGYIAKDTTAIVPGYAGTGTNTNLTDAHTADSSQFIFSATYRIA